MQDFKRFFSFNYLIERIKERGFRRCLQLFFFEIFCWMRPALKKIWSGPDKILYKNKNISNVMYAFYDLEVSPPTFDITWFLVLAESERIKNGCDFLHVIIIPGKSDGFRKRDLPEYIELGGEFDIDTMWWRLRNILVPCCWLIPSCKQITVCTSRLEAKGIQMSIAKYVFPEGYTVSFPEANYDCKPIYCEEHSNVDFRSLRATPQALRYVNEWIKDKAGVRKIITITLRECYDTARNSNLEVWGTFARSLDPKIYCPVIIRDTEAIFKSSPVEIDKLLVFPEVSWNIELRMALYELSYLNMFVNSGPSVLCLLNSRTRYIVFKKIVSDIMEEYHRRRGIEAGVQIPHTNIFQRQVWDHDRIEIIEKEFKEMCDRIEGLTS